MTAQLQRADAGSSGSSDEKDSEIARPVLTPNHYGRIEELVEAIHFACTRMPVAAIIGRATGR